jgi:phosphoglycolate phosphatase-like HAD superfamily hydrolase
MYAEIKPFIDNLEGFKMSIVPFPDFPRAAFLDWDGTFCDSRESIYEINVIMARHYGVVMPSFEAWLQASHPGVEPCMRALGVTEDREKINVFFHRLLVEQREAGFQNPLYTDTHEVLAFFQSRKIPAVVISRHLHEHLVRDIAAHGLTQYFHEVIGEPADANLEKDVVIRTVCEGFGIAPNQAFYLGDTSHDMRLAR